jgi:hypothetical protein
VLEPIDSSYNQYGLVPVPTQSGFVSKKVVCQIICIGGGRRYDAGLNLRSIWLSYESDYLFIVFCPNLTALNAKAGLMNWSCEFSFCPVQPLEGSTRGIPYVGIVDVYLWRFCFKCCCVCFLNHRVFDLIFSVGMTNEKKKSRG